MSVLEQPLVFVDVETNGLNHIRGRVIEVAVVRVEGGVIVREFNQLIDPGSELPQFITRLTGITSGDLKTAPSFAQIADELADILGGAVFVAHNVRFDYSFIKQEFKRVGKPFLPKQLCTVKLSRSLYPQEKSHKLESLISRYGFGFEHRHRAYDDALVLWQFLQHVQKNFPAETIEAAVKKQIGRPALPNHLDAKLVQDLPDGPGVYVFEDERGAPMYVGKSINIRKRVLQHFGHDHDDSKEFKMSQGIRSISTRRTAGELEALLLESQLVKELQPLYNIKLRKTTKVTVAWAIADPKGYKRVSIEETDAQKLEPEAGDLLGVYPGKARAKSSLETMRRTFDLCPKLIGLEKGGGACFLSQLGKCRGACTGKEVPETYNRRLLTAFDNRRIKDWPYRGPILLQEKTEGEPPKTGIIVDQWRVLANVTQDDYCEPEITKRTSVFDLDTYKILRDFLTTKLPRLNIQPLSYDQLSRLLG